LGERDGRTGTGGNGSYYTPKAVLENWIGESVETYLVFGQYYILHIPMMCRPVQVSNIIKVERKGEKKGIGGKCSVNIRISSF
jgi:hypothetical protein